MINLNFVNKVPKIAKDNEIILLTQKIKKSKEIEELTKSVFSNKLFLEQNFLTKDYNNKSYILVNCTKSKVSLDFEKLGSKLFNFLKDNKKENSFINVENNSFTNAQLEKFLHGAQLKSYNFNLYKTDKKKDININLSVVGRNVKQIN
jgi:leucyl aminopeptidase